MSVSQEFMPGVGELAELIRRKDWSRTPLGPIETWPQSLRTTVSLCLASNFPINIIWGPEHTQIYNDGYRDCCGDAHPRALGEDYSVTWASAWPAIGESFRRALAGETMYLENQRMFLKRYGYLEETFFTFSHSPIRDESGGIGGLFHPVTETTATMLAERRTRALRDLSAGVGMATEEPEVARRAVEVLSHFEFDLPFLLFYTHDPKAASYRLAAYSGIAPGTIVTPRSMEIDASCPWPFLDALALRQTVEIDGLPATLHGEPCGPYEEPPNTGFAIPITVPGIERPPMMIVTAASPRLPMTAAYRSFFHLLAITISGALATVRAREDERRRAEALAEIDRAKTLFFSNVSHEFRTPLTLLLGPLEDTLGNASLPAVERERLDMAHRNALRLLKLVNSLLDFSRIEAGRMQAAYEPADLAALTADLASNFRAACERAKLELVVECPTLPESIYVDRDMWEKIVLNLLSNAFKFTFQGKIHVRLQAVEGNAELSIRDTGVGIPKRELPRLFERFHRIEGQRSRTYEGSGIGLALVQELVRLHGGSIFAESEENRGTDITIRIPFGTEHLPKDRIRAARTLSSTSIRANAYVEEALRWMPDGEPEAATSDETGRGGTTALPRGMRVLLADDNADMRAYVRHLLGRNCELETVADGQAAIEAIHERRPDLVLADVMMPRLDGFGLLRAIRADPGCRDIPVIMLSARAGEESRVEGLDAGADDYLVKPFSARELLARVAASLTAAKLRREATAAIAESEKRFRAFVTASAGAVFRLSPDFSEMRQFRGKDFLTKAEDPDKNWMDKYIHPEDRARVLAAIREAIRAKSVFEIEHRALRGDGSPGWTLARAVPLLDARGEIVEWFGAARDVTARKLAEQGLEDATARFRFMAESMPQKVFTAKPTGDIDYFNQHFLDFTGFSFEHSKNWGWTQFIHPEDADETLQLWRRSIATGDRFQCVHRFRRADGLYRWHLSQAHAKRDGEGAISMWIGSNTDIHEAKEIEAHLRRANEDLNQFTFAVSHDLQEPLRMVTAYSQLLLQSSGEEASLCVRFIEEGARRMRELLADLLAYTQVAIRGEEPAECVDANAAFASATENLLAAIEESGAAVASGHLPTVRARQVHFVQLFQNLIGNAIKYRSDAPPQIRVSVERNADEWRFAVADNGIGIEPEYQRTIFGVFKRLHDHTIPGTGIGLAICQRIVDQWSGRIWVESQPGRGSTFYFTLPIAGGELK